MSGAVFQSNTQYIAVIPMESANTNQADALAWCMTYPFNMLSRCPVLSVPSGFANNGVPTGIQIVGRAYEDASVFRAATAFERTVPWAYDRPKNRPR